MVNWRRSTTSRISNPSIYLTHTKAKHNLIYFGTYFLLFRMGGEGALWAVYDEWPLDYWRRNKGCASASIFSKRETRPVSETLRLIFVAGNLSRKFECSGGCQRRSILLLYRKRHVDGVRVRY